MSLPKGWAASTLGEICQKPQYGWTTKASSAPSALKLLRTTDISHGEVVWGDVPYCTDVPDSPDKYRLADGDILISRSGSVGVSHLVRQPEPAVFASYLIRFRVKGGAKPQWVKYFLESPEYWKQIAQQASGNTLMNVNARQLSAIVIPIAPLEVQELILDQIDRQVTRLEKATDSLRRSSAVLIGYRRAVTRAAVDGHNGAPVVRVEEIGAADEQVVLTGPFGTALGKDAFTFSGIPVLTIGSLTYSGIDSSKFQYVDPNKAKELSRYRVRAGDLLFSRMATVGRVGLVGEREAGALINYHLMRLRLDAGRVDPRYFLAFVRGSSLVQDYLREVNHGATRPGIASKDLLNLPVRLPSLSQQHQMVDEIEKHDSVVSLLSVEVASDLRRSARLRASILSRAFSGRLVKEAV